MRIEFDLNGTSGYTDYSDYVDLTTFKRTKSLNGDNDPQKTISSEIEVFDDLYADIKTNLIDSSNRYSNFYVIKITDTECGNEEYLFKIEDKSFKWCDNGECRMNLTLVEYSPLLDCIKRTTIAYNGAGEFQDYPTSGTPHPRFRYCDVVKPTFLYGMIVTFVNAVSLFIASLNLVIASITGIIVWVVNILGGSWSVPSIGFGFAEDMLGCSRGHPAPFVRTYIDNVCNECGLSVTNTTIPIFYDDAGGTNNYYNTCLLTAYTTKGVDMDGGKDYIANNQPSWTLDKLLSILKVPFNSRWYIYDDVLYFERKDLIGELIYGAGNAIDLSAGDASYLLGDVCYTYNGQGKPKKIFLKYGTDASDNIGNELLSRFNGIYEDVSGNTNYNETEEINCYELGATSCVLDGKDSAYDANIDKALSGVLTSSNYAGCLKTQGDTMALARLLLYDVATGTIDDARVGGTMYTLYNAINAFSNDDANFFPLTEMDCSNYNFCFSFDPDADDIGGSGFRNLWQFHEIYIPSNDKKSNIDIDFTLEYCCRYNELDLYQKVMLSDGVTTAEIYSIEWNHSNREIKIKAKLI